MKPVVLAILDGWGEEPASPHNAIALASTPSMDALKREFPHGVINASELHVGLPAGQMGNSEVGHMNIGSGRVVMQELPKIDQAIASGTLEKNPRLRAFIEKTKQGSGRCHLIGLLSPGGVHAHQAHMAALANMLGKAGVEVLVHAFLDGRDTPPQSAVEYVAEFQRALVGNVRFATVSGRYYAMDRDKRWERVKLAYMTMAAGEGVREDSIEQAIAHSYDNGKTDEFLLPTALGDYAGMQDGDSLLMANFRADRAREILSALLDPAFVGFELPRRVTFSAALGMVEYSSAHAAWVETLFPPEPLNAILGEIVANAGRTQLRIAETEKYAHVTFFFNGGREQEFPGEERILVPSPKVATYDLKPEMSAFEVTEKLLAAIESGTFDLIVVNYANTDMVGHTGNVNAARQAVEAVDACVGKVAQAVLARGGALVVTADHGNAECMFDHDTVQPHTAHTLNLVPVIVAAPSLRGKAVELREGRLADIAPTLLSLLGLPQPAEMTGRSLIDEVR